ncbi:MAG: class II aldolase/adducin family protein [Vulcanimicrobiota bacterium]
MNSWDRSLNSESVKTIVREILLKKPELAADQVVPIVIDVIKRITPIPEIEKFRAQIIDAGRHLYNIGFMPATSGNISVRLPDNTLLISASGIKKGKLKPADILHIDLSGRIVTPSDRKPSSETKMHLAVYRERPDINVVVHTHPPYSTALAAARITLDAPILPETILFLGKIPLVEYSTPSTREVSDNLIPWLSDHQAFLLANHGALVLGENLEQAVDRMELLENYARIYSVSNQLGGPVELTRQELSRLIDVWKNRGS